MTEKRSILLLASAAALTLVFHESALSAPPVDQPTASTATTEPTMATSPVPGPTSKTGKTPDAGAATASSEPDTASPWTSMHRSHRGRPGRMTAEERKARWEEQFRKMGERAMQRNREIQETTERWESYWKALDAMTPEQKEAIYAIFGQGPRRCSCASRAMDRRTRPAMPMLPRSGRSEFDFPTPPGSGYPGFDPSFQRPDRTYYGQGSQRTQPYPFEKYPTPFYR
ncbi:MAG: hypothetical protein [Olavius algarvensis Gamma 1 endosymbiont]|nr:MAG: hypothetical protein [Olavius algarvensis Gamma 1 endosymbiont]